LSIIVLFLASCVLSNVFTIIKVKTECQQGAGVVSGRNKAALKLATRLGFSRLVLRVRL